MDIDLSKCTLLSKGLCGECYRINDETVLKLYFEDFPEDMVQREKQYAKKAFVLGIPTAISFHQIKVGNRDGIIFELLNAKTLSSIVADDFDNVEKYVVMFVDFLKKVHSTKCEDTTLFPKCLDTYKKLSAQVTWLSSAQMSALNRCIAGINDVNTCVHGDMHTSNIMVQNGELLLIDMGDFSIGDPLNDIAHIYNIFVRDYSNDMGKSITHLDKAERMIFWKLFIKHYYGELDETSYAQITHEIRKVVCVRQIFYILNFPSSAAENIAFMKEVLDEC